MRVSRGPKTLALNPYPLQETQASLGTPSQMGPWRSGVAAASAQVCPYQAQQHSWKINPQQLAESSHGFPDCRGRAVMGGKAKGKPLEQPLLRKTAHQPASLVGLRGQCLHPGLEGCRGGEAVIPTTAHAIWLTQKTVGLGGVRLMRWWLQLQLLYQAWFHCLSKFTPSLVPSVHPWI